MIDRVTRSDVYASLLEHTPPLALARRRAPEHRELTAWCRGRLRRGAWFDGDNPPAWKRVVAHIVAIEDLVRAFSRTAPAATIVEASPGERHRPDVLTLRQIADSVRVGGLGALAKLAADPSEHEAYVRRAVVRSDYAASVRAGEVPAWERAFAMVLYTQDALRWLDGRTRGGLAHRGAIDEPPARLPPEPGSKPRRRSAAALAQAIAAAAAPPPERDPQPVRRVERHADIAGYSFDPSWVNGGIAAFRPDPGKEPERELRGVAKFETVPDEKRLAAKPEPHVQGIKAFASVADAECEGVPELAWFYCGAAFELGLFSSLESMIATCLHGGPEEGSTGTSPTGPGDLARLAAANHRRILGNLATLEHRHQRALRLAYTDQRYPRAWVLEYFGFGVAAIVWAAADAAGEKRLGKDQDGEVVLTPATLRTLEDWGRADWPTFDASTEGEGVPLLARIKRAAALVLWTAHQAYLRAALAPVSAREKAHAVLAERARQKAAEAVVEPPKPKTRRVKVLVPAGERGGSKRRLIPQVIEVPVPTGGAPRAA